MDYLVHHLLRCGAERSPDKEALIDGERRLSYGEAWRTVGGVAAGLRDVGIQKSDRIGVFLNPSLELALSVFAVSRSGGVWVPMHHSLFPPQIEHIVRDCGMRGLITDRKKLNTLTDVIEQCPSLEFVIVVDDDTHPPLGVSIASWQVMATQGGVARLSERAMEQDLAAILYTSGSTGKPKGVMLSHHNIISGASIVSEYLELTAEDRLLATLPLSFDAGLNQLTTSIQQGGTCVLIHFYLGREIVNALERERITGLAGVPPLWNLLAQSNSGLGSRHLPHLRYITNTGGALPTPTLATLRKFLPTTRVFLMYGLTEAFRSTYLPPDELDRRPSSMGRAIPNTEILVVNERGELAAPGEVGELVHHGPTVSMGYWGRPDLTDDVFRPHPFTPLGEAERPKVCYSGDLVRRDDDGFLFFVGRRDNLIKSAGFRISPTEVEEVLSQSGQVRDAAVVGVPDESLGQSIVGFVTPAEGGRVDADVLIGWCARHLPRHMIPKRIVTLETLPKTASGKVDYATLRDRVIQHDSDPELGGVRHHGNAEVVQAEIIE